MIKKLTRHGNSMALVIDKPILELLHIERDTPLEARSPHARSLNTASACWPSRTIHTKLELT